MVIAQDAVLTGEQKHCEDTTAGKRKSEEGGPTISKATPEGGERVYERKDRDASRHVLSRAGGPANEHITRREVFDLRTGQRIETYRCSVGGVTGDDVAILTDPLPREVKDHRRRRSMDWARCRMVIILKPRRSRVSTRPCSCSRERAVSSSHQFFIKTSTARRAQ